MFVSDDLLEKGMDITYDDIRASREALEQKYLKRKTELHEYGYKIVRSYKESLKLPDNHYVKADGSQRAYVTCGVINSKQNYESRPLSVMPLDDNYGLQFLISTAVEDSPASNDQYVYVEVYIWKEAGILMVTIDKQDTLSVPYPEEDNAFAGVDALIKSRVLFKCTDKRLD